MATDSAKAAQDDIEKLREELAQMRAAIEGLGPAAKAGARAARSAAENATNAAQAKAREYGEYAATTVRDNVHAHPFVSLGIAFVAGAVTALLVRR